MNLLNKIILSSLIIATNYTPTFAMQDDESPKKTHIRTQRPDDMNSESTAEEPATKKQAAMALNEQNFFDSLPNEIIIYEILPQMLSNVDDHEELFQALINIAKLKQTDRRFYSILTNEAIIRAMHATGVDINATIDDPTSEDNGFAPLLIAAKNNNLNLVKHLISLNANVNITVDNPISDYHRYTALEFAIENNNLAMTQELLTHGANANYVIDGDTSIISAIATGNLQIIQELITHGANINTAIDNTESPVHGYTPLHVAIVFFATEGIGFTIIHELITHGADINAVINNPESHVNNFTPLRLTHKLQSDLADELNSDPARNEQINAIEQKLIAHGAHE